MIKDEQDTRMNANLPLWTIDRSEYLVSDRFIRLRVDACTTPQGGRVGKYYVLEYGDWVNCLAIDTDCNAIILRHYRHGVRNYLMEFIGGGIEESESPLVAAKRELREEAGYTGGSVFHVGTSYANPASHTNKVHTFLAVGGKISHKQNLEVGETLSVEKIPFKTVIEAMSKPEAIYPALYVTALFHAMNFIRTSEEPALRYLKPYIS